MKHAPSEAPETRQARQDQGRLLQLREQLQHERDGRKRTADGNDAHNGTGTCTGTGSSQQEKRAAADARTGSSQGRKRAREVDKDDGTGNGTKRAAADARAGNSQGRKRARPDQESTTPPTSGKKKTPKKKGQSKNKTKKPRSADGKLRQRGRCQDKYEKG